VNFTIFGGEMDLPLGGSAGSVVEYVIFNFGS